ncbi:alpha/beta hydrolase family protein [Nitrososphaera sp. AFS]|uniref:alpha/beta hydrolase family protein n=1 Tax=Nitrososphaera sp. AFS TaxID=2301191 RepID=UPI0013922A5A|nr:alpha/beta fold hydrolase [Nitrososphaera sp. AFS]NAL77938.1 alpha/beta fold hydrolase [Nitrososphaera sp. AFS]
MKIVFQDPTFSLQLLRTIGETYYKGADVGECLSTAYRIKEGDFESWHEEWLKTAKRIHRFADESLAFGHKVSAREAYLRASNYYRVAEFLLMDPEDPRIQATWGGSKECFSKAAGLFSPPFESIEIPYEGTSLPGYFYRVDDNNDSRPPRSTLIVHGGFDSTVEELYTSAAAPALERGYNCLTFEGPGQGGVIRKQKIPFRYDWEKVVTPVVEYALSRPEEIDPEHIALMGISMGGYLAARAVAFEHRIAACILNGGVFDGYEAFASGFPKSLLTAIDNGNSEYVNTFLNNLSESDPNIRFNLEHGMWTAGANTPFELVHGSKDYSIKNIAQNIKCPTLVLEAEKDESFPGQPKKVFDALTCPKKLILFTAEEGAEEHCQCGASALSNQRILDWLDEMFQKS